MNWTLTAQIVVIVVAYVGGILAIGRFMTHSLGKRIDHLNDRIDDLASKTTSDNLAIIRLIEGLDKRMDDMNNNINARFEDMNGRFEDMNANMNARFEDMNTNINARFNDMNNRFDDLSRQIDTRIGDVNERFGDTNGRIDDLRAQMIRDHDNLSRKVDTLTDTVTAHITNQDIHGGPRDQASG